MEPIDQANRCDDLPEYTFKTAPQRLYVNLPEYVGEIECRCFDEYIDSLSTVTELSVSFLVGCCNSITQEAMEEFGPDTSTEVCGSVAKDTFVESSDCDFYIHTIKPVNRAQRLKFTNRLKKLFGDFHASLGKRAIHVSTGLGDIDVVCSNTVEYGELTRGDKTIADNAELKYAVKALKIWAKHGIEGKVPGHCLEKMAQEVQRAYRLPKDPASTSSGMRLFVSVLQSIVDSEGDRIFGFPSRTGQTSNVRRLAQTTVHVFAVSRASRGEFRSPAEISGWLCTGLQDTPQETEVGRVPGWLLSADGRSDSVHVMALFDRHTRKAAPLPCSGDSGMYALHLLLASPLGKYTLRGSQMKVAGNMEGLSGSSLPEHLNLRRLQELASAGSTVAQRMCQTRYLWLQGDAALSAKLQVPAVALLASSLRLGSRDGDPFNGIYLAGQEEYVAACDYVLSIDVKNVDARLVRANLYMSNHQWYLAEAELAEAIKYSPNDAYGCLHTMLSILGCCSRWSEALPFSERCVQIEPDEAIFYYWRAFFRKTCLTCLDLTPSSFNPSDIANYKLCVDDLQKFLHLTSPGGRKVAQAWYELSNLRLMTHSRDNREFGLLCLENDIKSAQQAEREQLPVFPPLKCDSKLIAESVLVSLKTKLPQNAEGYKSLGNTCFQGKNYVEAIRYYTTALSLAPEDYKVRCNRSAAYTAMGWFTAAAKDADDAAGLKPDWSKPYYRAAVAYLELRQFDKAVAAASTALLYASKDETVSVQKVLQEAQELCTQTLATARQEKPAGLPPCWPDVMFKERPMATTPTQPLPTPYTTAWLSMEATLRWSFDLVSS